VYDTTGALCVWQIDASRETAAKELQQNKDKKMEWEVRPEDACIHMYHHMHVHVHKNMQTMTTGMCYCS
jgi:hypothetical protein